MNFHIEQFSIIETVCQHVIVTSLFAIGFMGFLSKRFIPISHHTNLKNRQN